ncbi:acetyl/propionyl/methylcrotonyl-CoA carboxylase subunit alpha [Parendozoicomonas haliclonae]|uniref:Biotin carboxylase n=1 Tax=Parendozoicomonas haliclonae TaxID=1960125 RepID=A0A1X7AKH1_9GAMM|nr:biotin carboxylase N-terminal domain-containing protein [Parendozoicomonas haliclonae]SMA47887.1 Acetyl-/propionyl-coenzyme A carboxylase alpha chain [Parendozoicomonas haliclonae]
MTAMTTNNNQPIKKLLIANRGEIACRVIRTARTLGIETALISSEPDATSLAAEMADKVFVIGPAAAADSYLRQDKVIEVARQWQADAVHPGYGFLSENADFANALEAAGIRFIGPPSSAMSAMASKSEAKRLMEQAGVPLLKGYHGTDQADSTLSEAADAIGYPVMLKAAAGGGGKGMRIVSSPSDFQSTLDSARREAEKAFGDTTMLVEKYLAAPRHIEVQIFFDQHGQGVYLFDRDCSIQRRHQKVVEEAPAPGLPDRLRNTMGEAALAAGRSIGYVGAGTVEFLLDTAGDGDQFYFMEMNTRLQVEHPVTEMVTGQDLVEWQIRVTEGQPLPCSQEQLQLRGHSLEVRLYAEEPAREFLPATGTLSHLHWPAEQNWLRVETGVRAGDEVTPWYDPMIAKLVVHGDDREQACQRMLEVLQHTRITGLSTNRDFLIKVLEQPAFQQQAPDTCFIPRFQTTLLDNSKAKHLALIAATLAPQSHSRHAGLSEAYNGWRLHQQKQWYGHWQYQGETFTVLVESGANGCSARINGQQVPVTTLETIDDTIVVNGVVHDIYQEASYGSHDRRLTVVSPALTLPLHKPDHSVAEHDEQDLTAPMNGRVVAVMVEAGQTVNEGDTLLVLEAMKMEQTIRAPHAGVIADIHHTADSLVEEGALLVSFVDTSLAEASLDNTAEDG